MIERNFTGFVFKWDTIIFQASRNPPTFHNDNAVLVRDNQKMVIHWQVRIIDTVQYKKSKDKPSHMEYLIYLTGILKRKTTTLHKAAT